MAELDLAACDALILRATGGDTDALRELTGMLWPHWLEQARAHPGIRSLPHVEDQARQVAMVLAGKLARREGHALRLYLLWRERHPGKTLGDWTRIVTKNAIRNHLEAQLGPARRKGSGGEPSPKRLLNEAASSSLLDELGVRPGVTAAQTARELLEYAARYLASGEQRALSLWLEGESFASIAEALGKAEVEVLKLQRRAVATLRRHFVEKAAKADTS